MVAPKQAVLDARAGWRDLAFVHVPFNFGHTVEMYAYWSKFMPMNLAGEQVFLLGTDYPGAIPLPPSDVRPGGEVWAKLYPPLLEDSTVTGCPLYFTPPKYWPKDVAKAYFAGRKGFGILRDPAERLVAMFRGNMDFYGGGRKEYFEKCDVNGALEDIVKQMLAGKKKPEDREAYYGKSCTRVQQAEYFEGEYKADIVVDNRAFPHSVNKVFEEHGGYITTTDAPFLHGVDPWYIENPRILHVNGCNEVGTWNLTAATKALIREAYDKDYDLLCKTFNYCEEGEDTCLTYIDQMCPSWVDKEALRAKLADPPAPSR